MKNPSSQENNEMPVSANTTRSAANLNGQNIMTQAHLLAAEVPSNIDSIPPNLEDHPPCKMVTRYTECLKNHAAAMGGNATDGCGEFMPSGEEGSLEALTCSACNCHRNFHRKEIECECSHEYCYQYSTLFLNINDGRKLIFWGHHKGVVGQESLGYPTKSGSLISSGPEIPHQIIMCNKMGLSISSGSDEQEGGAKAVMKKRFRTKFTQEQKEKMLSFAEKAGWKIQKQEESVVQHFCQEIGISTRVLKVWMHNNKNNYAKKKLLPR